MTLLRRVVIRRRSSSSSIASSSPRVIIFGHRHSALTTNVSTTSTKIVIGWPVTRQKRDRDGSLDDFLRIKARSHLSSPELSRFLNDLDIFGRTYAFAKRMTGREKNEVTETIRMTGIVGRNMEPKI